MSRRKIKLKRRFVKMLELPEDVAFDVPRVTLVGGDSALIEYHRGIFEYSDETVRLNTGAGLLRIDGEMLELRELSEERLFICGAITSVSYEYKEGRMQHKK